MDDIITKFKMLNRLEREEVLAILAIIMVSDLKATKHVIDTKDCMVNIKLPNGYFERISGDN